MTDIQNELIAREFPAKFRGNFAITTLSLPEDLTYDEWIDCGAGLKRVAESSMWWLGDWWKFGTLHYGDHEEAAARTDWTYQTCRDAGWVAKKIELSRRRDNVPWSYHREIAALEPLDQEQFLTQWSTAASEGELPARAEARAEVAQFKRNRRRPNYEPPAVGLTDLGPFDVLYADPPWRYEYSPTDSRAIENQYPTMDLNDICALRPPAFDDAVLFLWATATKLDQALQVVTAWEFDYRSSMVWIKDKIGMGYYVRNQHELLLIAKRGEPPMPEPAARPASIVEAPRTEHSVKPDIFYALIETMYPGRRYAELFARRPRDGWASWGNQV